MADADPRPAYRICPSCGSDEFVIYGLVAYSEPYNSKKDKYGRPKLQWGIDYPQNAECKSCQISVTGLFKEYQILDFFGHPPEK